MAFTALKTWVTGEIVTAAMLNEQLRDNGNMYIQKDGSVAFTADQPMGGFSLTGLAAGAASGESARYDELHAISIDATPVRALTTIYQNSTKIRVVRASFSALNTGVEGFFTLNPLSDAATPPTVEVGKSTFVHATVNTHWGTIVFLVMPSHYYEIVSVQGNCGVPAKQYWVEWDLH